MMSAMTMSSSLVEWELSSCVSSTFRSSRKMSRRLLRMLMRLGRSRYLQKAPYLFCYGLMEIW